MGRRHRGSRGAAAPSAQENEELDIQAFSIVLERSGLCIRDVSNDGNCFFRAVSDQLYGTEDYHMKLRERVCDYLMTHKDDYQFFVDDEQSFDEYVAEMRTDGVWADNLELQAISMSCHVNIRVHQSGKPSYDIRNHASKNASTIHLSYHFGEHYASVRPLESAQLRVPTEHAPLPPPRPVETDSKQENHSVRHEGAARRPRHPPTTEEDCVNAVWKRAEKGHCDLCSLVDQTRRAACAIRNADGQSDEMDEKRDIAKRIERDVREARSTLEQIGDAIVTGKSTHRIRRRKMVQERVDKHQQRALQRAESEGLSSYSEDDESDEEQYKKSVRRKTDAIFATLDEMENDVLQALEKVKGLTAEPSEDPASSSSSSTRHSKGGKKKEQEAKKRERKERRRKEQERLARGVEGLHIPQNAPTHELDIAI